MSEESPISRRSFLGLRFRRLLAGALQDDQAPAGSAPSAPTSRHRRGFPLLRPPGAVDEDRFLSGCTRCNACAEACPYDAIFPAPDRFRQAANTPMIDPLRQPCWMCTDTPCITACEPGVLRREPPFRMGQARIDPLSCLAHQKSFCTVCSEQCPVPGAIEIVSGKPVIRDEICTGCGVCQHVCPAPQNAILLMPAEKRSSARDANEARRAPAASVDRSRRNSPAPWELDMGRAAAEKYTPKEPSDE